MSQAVRFLVLLVFFLGSLCPGIEVEIRPSRKILYKEEFYRLYYLPLYHREANYIRNIHWLKWAMKVAFAPPIRALTVCETPSQYEKYKILVKMHLNYLMTKNTVLLAARFDKHKPVWFNRPYKESILKSLKIARHYYTSALDHWEKVLYYQRLASSLKGTRIELDFLEDMIYKIEVGEVDYKRVVNRQLKKLEGTTSYFHNL